jgi:topoisomerase IA-like protein
MESESKVLGKINKKKCYLNHGKYGYYLTLDKNYKVPEWLPPDKMDIEIAERLIEYKIKMSEQWLESKPIKKKVESDSESEDEPPTSSKNKNKK